MTEIVQAACLVYLCVGITYMAAYAHREQFSALKSRAYMRDVLTDIQEANLMFLEEDLLEQMQQQGDARDGRELLVTGARRDDEQPDEDTGSDAMQGDLHTRIVMARSDR